MNTFICQSIQYLFAHLCRTDENGNIVPKSYFEFKELSSKEKINFSEKSRKDNGNILFEQTVTIKLKTDNTLLKDLTSSQLILKLQKTDGTFFTWGTLEPYNPVQVEINSENQQTELSFFRQSSSSEL